MPSLWMDSSALLQTILSCLAAFRLRSLPEAGVIAYRLSRLLPSQSSLLNAER